MDEIEKTKTIVIKVPRKDPSIDDAVELEDISIDKAKIPDMAKLRTEQHNIMDEIKMGEVVIPHFSGQGELTIRSPKADSQLQATGLSGEKLRNFLNNKDELLKDALSQISEDEMNSMKDVDLDDLYTVKGP